ncbi:MAG: hypothetical protein RIC38_08060, partial [Chromatocurvus sp.]
QVVCHRQGDDQLAVHGIKVGRAAEAKRARGSIQRQRRNAQLPVAAGVFVVSKVFEKQVERMSSGVYSVSGPVGSPQLRLKRIFDNTADELPPPAENSPAAGVMSPVSGEDSSVQADPVSEDPASSRR